MRTELGFICPRSDMRKFPWGCCEITIVMSALRVTGNTTSVPIEILLLHSAYVQTICERALELLICLSTAASVRNNARVHYHPAASRL